MPSTRGQKATVLHWVLFISFCAVLLAGPLALGVVEESTVARFEGASALLMLVWWLGQLFRPEIEIAWSPLFIPLVSFAVLVLSELAFHRTVYRYATISELWLYAAYGFFVFLSVQLFRSKNRAHFASAMAVFGSIYALFSIIQGFTSAGAIYWKIRPLDGNAYGSYVNHNHFAGLIEMLFPMAFVPVFTASVAGGKRILLSCGSLMMAASVFLSGSRGGMLALFVEIVFLALLTARNFPKRKLLGVVAVFCITTALFLAWVAPTQVGNRITDLHDPSRLLIHRDSVNMFLAHPVLGSGLGTFAIAFPHYRVFFDGFFVNHAHDDYLELLLETGLIGAAIALWFLIVVYREGMRHFRENNSSNINMAALAGCTGLLAHSFLDFNLHMPANAAIFFVLCALATTREQA